jgi:YidC/Oxa1 family membrane protein insertase
MDKNRATGLFLIMAILTVYFFFLAPDPAERQQMLEETTPIETAEIDTPVEEAYTPGLDTLFSKSSDSLGEIPASVNLRNELLDIQIDTKAGVVNRVELLKYQTYFGEPLVVIQPLRSKISESIDTQRGVLDLSFVKFRPTTLTDSLIVLEAQAQAGGTIRKVYRFGAKPYTVDYQITLSPELATSQGSVVMGWSNAMPLLEKGLKLSRMKSTVNYTTLEGDMDDLDEATTDLVEYISEDPLYWINHKQKFFNSGIISRNGLFNARATTVAPEFDSSTVKNTYFQVALPLQNGQTANDLTFFFGPNERNVLSGIAPEYEENVYYGWFLVRPINKYFIAPLFHLLENVSDNYGIVILLLVLLVKTILFPLQYKAYSSQAKQRVLKPELDELRKKYDGDFQKQQQETMKLYQRVGVSPLSGCIPLLIQMPVFIALFYYFPNIIELRGKSFLWAEDLSTYDSIINFSTNLPLLGNHLSLFTLLFTGSQLAYTYYNQQNTPTMGNPAQQVPIKVMGYAMPVFFLFFFNDYASGLTYYYFVSNMITIGQQLIIRSIIDDTKIKAKLEATRARNAQKEATGGGKKSKLLQRLEAAQKMQEEARRNQKKKR